MTENNENGKVWKYSALTQNGAHKLAIIMRDLYGCTILSKPTKTKKDTWEFKFSNPFLKKKK